MRDKNDLTLNKTNFIIVTGMSGAGKSTVLNVMEDMGYYCVDNIPSELIPDFYMLCNDSNKKNVAVVTDIRGGDMSESFFNMLKILDNQKKSYKILFLDSDIKSLVNRYKETRRLHPLNNSYPSLEECVRKEKERLLKVEQKSNFVIDSSSLSPTQLKHRIRGTFSMSDSEQPSLIIGCVSFGFKYGIPNDADLIFDARCFPNPFYIPELKNLTGLDKPVSDYVLGFKETQKFIEKFLPLIDFLLPLYQNEGKNELMIAIGCTGGKHRSVTIAEELCKHIGSRHYAAYTFHRDINNTK